MITRHSPAELGTAMLAVVVLGTVPAGASPGAGSGFGSRSRALAAADVADARGAPAVFENPAALVQTPDTELSLGASNTAFDFRVDGKDAELPSVQSVDFGVVVPGAVLTIPVAFGLSLSLPDGRLSKLHNADPTVPYYPLDDPGPRLVDLGMALALRPLPNLAIGGGAGFLAAAQGGFAVRGTAVPADGNGSEYESNLRHSVDADLVSVRYLLLGVTLQPSRDVVLGVSYRESATLLQEVRGDLAGSVRLGSADIPVRYDFETRARLAFLPSVAKFGGTVTSIPGLRVNLELDLEGWEESPSPYARPKTHVDVDLPPGVMIPMPAPAPLPKPTTFEDRWVPRLGVEKVFELDRAIDVLARAGYAYESAVVPADQAETLLIDLDRHLFALGAGLLMRRPFGPFGELRFDVHGALTQGVSRTVTGGLPGDHGPHRVTGRLFDAGATLDLAFDAY